MAMPQLVARLAACGFAASFTAVAAVPAQAQDAGTTEFPIVPDPAECQVEPRSADELLEIWYDPDVGPGTAASPAPGVAADAVVTNVTVPVGPPADEATTEAITETVREVFACFAAGDTLRAYSLFTDELALAFGPVGGVSREEAEAFLAVPSTPVPAEAQGQIVTVASPMVLDDGRVGAFVVDRTGDEQSAAYAIFERQGDTWLVDGLIEFGVGFEQVTDGATPIP